MLSAGLPGPSMPDVTAEFFDALRRRGPEPLLGNARGSLRVELTNRGRERWLISIDRGKLAVSRRSGKADCTVRARKEVFDRVFDGTQNAMAAMLRGELTVDGDPMLLVRFQRLLPSPPRIER
jgi:putative sterol carrier protein